MIVSKRTALAVLVFICTLSNVAAAPLYDSIPADEATSTRQQAIAFVDSIRHLDASPSWPNIKPALFLQNLKTTVHDPVSIYPGNGTNFCGYGALTYLFLQDDPLGYAKLILQLYQQGKATFGTTSFQPSASITKEAGLLRYKGILDIHPADQMWFLTLADHYKGYLNLFNRNYDPGDEDTFWASVNFAKFNRMVRNLLHYKVKAKGADLMRPHVGNLYQYISKRMQTGRVALFINNRIVHKKNHINLKLRVPTHFIIAEKISFADDVITLVYWDYGGRTLLQMSPTFFKRIIFGITYCTKKENNAR